MELTDNDRQRIEQEADKYAFVECNQTYAENLGFVKGAEYATIYERAQHSGRHTDNYLKLHKDYMKLKKQVSQLEVERTELRNKAEEYRRLLLRAEMYVLPTEQTNGLIVDIQNSLKTK